MHSVLGPVHLMTRMTFQSGCRFAGWIAFFAVVVLSLVPGTYRPHTGMPGPLEHVSAYAMTSCVLALGYGSRARVKVLLVLALCAVTLEILQFWVPGRNPQIIDFLASSVGAILGIALANGSSQRLAPGSK